MENGIGKLIKSADWKNEKHVPVIAAPAAVKAGEAFEVEVAVGKEIPHPNTVEHHIAWAALYFVAEGAPLPVELARATFAAHGGVAVAPARKATVALPKSGTLYAVSYCNLHGLWESAKEIAAE